MDFEQRLRSHLDEQAKSLDIDTADPAHIIANTGKGRSTVTSLAALVVVLAGAVGFWLLSSGDPGPVTEIAAGEAADADSGAESGGQGSVGVHTPLEFIDVTSANSPGFGQVLSDDGIYYVLSSAPGRVDINANLSEQEAMELYRQNTFYAYDQANGWTVNKMEDRFISDFDADNGLLYAVSTGSKSGKPAAFGTSADRGQTWTWTDITDLPETDQLTMLRTDDRTVLFATRWGFPERKEVIKVAADAGLPVSEYALREFDHRGFSYVEVDPDDPCAAIRTPYLEQFQSLTAWMEQASEEEQENLQMEYQSMVQWANEELAGSGCELPEESASIDGILALDLPDPIRVSWAEIGFTPPETWQSWSSVFVDNGEGFTDVGLPFDGSDLQIGYASSEGGRLTIHAWADEADFEAEIRWSTADGESWEREMIRYDEAAEEEIYYDAFHPLPTAGEYIYRAWWDESAFEEAEDARGEYIEQGPLLQRSRAGRPFETMTLAEVAPSVDVGEAILYDVRGTPFGVFLLYGPRGGPVPSAQSELTIVYSGNGVDWDTVELAGHSIETGLPGSADVGEAENMMVFAHTYSMGPDEQSSTQAFLVRPAG